MPQTEAPEADAQPSVTATTAQQAGVARALPSEGRPKTPPAQAGDPEVEMAKPVAQPVLQSVDEGKKELDANPARASVLTGAGHLVRER